jgi:transcriptional regulator with XRE-family HTH domain
MSYAVNGLAVGVSAYTWPVVDASLARQLLRTLRKRHFSSSREAAVAAGISASTAEKIENLKGAPDYDPGIGIILKLLAAMKTSLITFAKELQTIDSTFESQKKSATSPGKHLQVSDAREEDIPSAHTSQEGTDARTISDGLSTPALILAAAEIIGARIDAGFQRMDTRLKQIAATRAPASNRRVRHSARARKTG